MERLQEYVPKVLREDLIEVSGRTVILDKGSMLPIFLGGDQLTAARARGALSTMACHDRSADRLEGLIPVVEDWHASLTLPRCVCTPTFLYLLQRAWYGLFGYVCFRISLLNTKALSSGLIKQVINHSTVHAHTGTVIRIQIHGTVWVRRVGTSQVHSFANSFVARSNVNTTSENSGSACWFNQRPVAKRRPN